jgi:LacI family transcriptional regulator
MMTSTDDSDGMLKRLIGNRRNVVLVDGDIPDVGVPRVLVENERGTYDGTRHLIEAGHRKIAYLGGTVGVPVVEERRAGYLRALRDAGISVRDEFIRIGSYAREAAKQAVLDLLAMHDPPTAIFASSDNLTVGAILGLRSAGVSVPDEISMVAFDDVPMTELWQPPLTSIRQPIEALGRKGFLTLYSLLQGGQPPMVTRLPVELVERESVGPPRTGRL